MEARKDELYHHGILGMKWGVRRYQNYDGSYTQRGLKRYRQAEQNYETANTFKKTAKGLFKNGGVVKDPKTGEYKEIRLSKNAYKEAKANTKQAKKELVNSYKQLKKDNLADKGKELYRQGYRITDSYNSYRYAAIGSSLASYAVHEAMKDNNKTKYIKYLGKAYYTRDLTAGAVALGGAAVTAMLYANYRNKQKKLSAYYGH